jgi:hypothetical protein
MAAAFRALVQARNTCKRFQPGKTIDDTVLKDVLEMTLVGIVCNATKFNIL